jgi:hypothetical protein
LKLNYAFFLQHFLLIVLDFFFSLESTFLTEGRRRFFFFFIAAQHLRYQKMATFYFLCLVFWCSALFFLSHKPTLAFLLLLYRTTLSPEFMK